MKVHHFQDYFIKFGIMYTIAQIITIQSSNVKWERPLFPSQWICNEVFLPVSVYLSPVTNHVNSARLRISYKSNRINIAISNCFISFCGLNFSFHTWLWHKRSAELVSFFNFANTSVLPVLLCYSSGELHPGDKILHL